MKELLDAGVSSNADSSGDEGVCALSAAAGGGHLSAAKYLLDRGADVNADDFWGGNALVGASVEGEVDIVKLLLAHGADPNMEDDGASAIGYASHQLIVHENAAPRSNYRTIVDLLEANGAQTAGISRPWVWLAHMIPTF